MEIIKNRKTPLASKNKIANAMRLYERFVDEPIQNIRIWSSCSYEFEGSYNRYSVDISNNKVSKVYPDIE